jgi:hypothetical protein
MSSAWLGVASSAEGSNLVAAAFNVLGSGGQLLTSTNSGSAWASHETNRNWWAVASSADGRKLLAAVNGGQLYLSTNSGANWAATAFTNRWTTVACSWDGGRLIAAADFNGTGTGNIYVSPPLTPAAPALAVFITTTNTAVISWPTPSDLWNLQQNTNLGGGSWDVLLENINDDGTNKFIIVNPPAGNRLYRLSKP